MSRADCRVSSGFSSVECAHSFFSISQAVCLAQEGRRENSLAVTQLTGMLDELEESLTDVANSIALKQRFSVKLVAEFWKSMQGEYEGLINLPL